MVAAFLTTLALSGREAPGPPGGGQARARASEPVAGR